MARIDWYILKKFVITFIFCMILFTLIAVAVDASEKTGELSRSGLGIWEIIRQYYFGFVPFIWGLLFPIFLFIAVIFFTSRMAARSEIIAILSSGASYNRMLRPYLAGGIFFALMLWFGNRYLIPGANRIKNNFESVYIDKDKQRRGNFSSDCFNCYYRRIDTNTFIGIRNYDTANKSAGAFFLERIKDNKVIFNLRANSIRWDTAVNKWKIFDVTERRIDSMQETVIQYPDTVLNINLKPEELRHDEFLKDKLTTPELVAIIKREEMRGTEGLSTLKVEQYRRSATAFTVVLLTFIGVIISSRKNRGGSGMHLALGIIIAAIFIISDRFSSVFATKGNFHPLLAAWLPNIVFTGIAYWMYRKAPK